MNENIELGNFRELIESMDGYSKVIEVAIEVDENSEGGNSDASHQESLFNSYGRAIKELTELDHEEDEYEASIFLELKEDEFSENKFQYVDVHLVNDNYNETIVVQPEMNFDDYGNYKTFAMDFMPWAQLLNKNVRVSPEVAAQVPTGFTLEEYTLGHIMWELTFYGFSSGQIASELELLKNVSKDSAIELDELLESQDNLLDEA